MGNLEINDEDIEITVAQISGKLTVGGAATLKGTNTISDATFNGNLIISLPQLYESGSNVFGKCVVKGNGTFNTNNTFDVLELTPSKTYTFKADSVQTINDSLIAVGTAPANHITINSGTNGIATTLHLAQNTSCFDFLILKDVTVTGIVPCFCRIQ